MKAGGADPTAAGGRSETRPAGGDSRGGGRGGETTITPEQESMALLSGRYVDGDGKPMPFDGDQTKVRNGFGTEYKRLPVRLVIEMDLKSLTYLITQCVTISRCKSRCRKYASIRLDGGGRWRAFRNSRWDPRGLEAFGCVGSNVKTYFHPMKIWCGSSFKVSFTSLTSRTNQYIPTPQPQRIE